MTHPHEALTKLPAFDPTILDDVKINFVDHSPESTDAAFSQPLTTALMARKTAMENAKIARQLAEEEADRNGELWTMQAAVKRRGTSPTVFVVFKLGSHCTDEQEEAFASQHRDAAMTLDPMHIIGNKAECIAHVGSMWKCDEYTIRFVV